MRVFLLTSSLLMAPISVLAEQQCLLPPSTQVASAPSLSAEGKILKPSPLSAPTQSTMLPTGPRSAITNSTLTETPVLAHIVGAGAHLIDLGVSHGMHTVLARSGEQLMVFEVAPDGQAAVSGLMADLSASQLLAAASDRVTELDTRHSLRTLFVRKERLKRLWKARIPRRLLTSPCLSSRLLRMVGSLENIKQALLGMFFVE